MSNRRHQQGFSLVSAVFLLVVLAGLGAVATRLTAFQQQSTNQALLSTQGLACREIGRGLGGPQGTRRKLRGCNAKPHRGGTERFSAVNRLQPKQSR